MMREHRGLGWGIILLFFGLVLLLVNLDIINWSVFRSFWVLWPLLLVVAGVSVLARHRRWIVIVTWGVFLVLLVVYGYFYTQPDFRVNHWSFSTRTHTIETEGGVDSGVLRLDVDAGDIDIAGGGDDFAVMDTNDRRLDLTTRTSGDTQTVEIRDTHNITFWNFGGFRSDIALASDIPWEIDVETDAANTEIDMGELMVSNLDLRGNVCNLKVELSDNVPACSISVRSDVSHITIVVPENVGVRYTVDGDLRSVHHDNVRFVKNGGWQETENFDAYDTQVEIGIETDVGYVTFTR